MIYAGAGVEKSGAGERLVRFAEEHFIPVATTMRAKGVFPENHPLSLGVFGYAGHRHAIETILSDDVEVLLVLGSGLNQRDTMFWNKKMLPSRALVHVEVDPTVIGRTWATEVPLLGDCGAVLDRLLERHDGLGKGLEAGVAARKEWVESIRASGPVYYDEENVSSNAEPIHPARVVAELRKAMPEDGALVSDSGAHRAFCCQYWKSYDPKTYFSATNLGPMGWAIPALHRRQGRPEGSPGCHHHRGRLHAHARH